jgi:hypothetical protein
LTCLTAPLLISYGWLHYQKNLVRKDVKRQILAGLDENQLVLLKFTEADSKDLLHWEHAQEFEFKGQMFDVVSIETKGDTIYYRCWLDKKESELDRQVKQLIAQALEKDPNHQESQKQLSHFFKALYSLDPQFLPLIAFENEDHQRIFTTVARWVSNSISPGVPPPKAS